MHSSPPRLIGWIDVVVVWARHPFVASEALHGSSGEKAEVPNTSHIIMSTGPKPPLWFPSVV
jgi:hypothetical protein